MATASPPPQDPNGSASEQALDGETSVEVAARMASSHRDVVELLVGELRTCKERGATARDRLSHTLVLLDETQAELVAVARERDQLAKAKSDLQTEVARLQAENSRLAQSLDSAREDLEAHRRLVNAAYDDSGRNRALLQQTLRNTLTASDDSRSPSAASPSSCAPMRKTVSPAPTLASSLTMPTRPPQPVRTLQADPHLSHSVALSSDQHVAVATADTSLVDPASAVFALHSSTQFLGFVASVRSNMHRGVQVGFAAIPLSGSLAASPLRCLLRGDGVVLIVSDGNEIEVPLSPQEPVAADKAASALARTYTVRWDAVQRRVTFAIAGTATGAPICLPPVFTREAMCPVVVLPSPGDEVVVRSEHSAVV